MDTDQRNTELCEEATGRDKGAAILVVLRLGLNIPGGGRTDGEKSQV